MNKPFLLIAGDNYYPDQGTGDWVDRFETLEDAQRVVNRTLISSIYGIKINGKSYDWYEIVNLETWIPELRGLAN